MEQIEQSIPQRFENVLRAFPDRLPVKMGDVSLTYAELNRAADRVTWNLLNAPGHEQEPVAVLFNQRVLAVAALLGILRAGKFYVPLDTSYPSRRNKFILEDSGPG